MSKQAPCSNIANHTPRPAGYAAYQAWAYEMLRTTTCSQSRCPVCGLYAIWLPNKPGLEPLPATYTGCMSCPGFPTKAERREGGRDGE